MTRQTIGLAFTALLQADKSFPVQVFDRLNCSLLRKTTDRFRMWHYRPEPVTAQGKPVSIVLLAAEMPPQAAADMIGCSRPHFVKLLEGGAIPYTKVGKHPRVEVEDVMVYKKAMKEKQEKLLIEMMREDEEARLYDS